MMFFFTLVNSGVLVKFHEGFNKKNHIVLMGDSIFANENYVYYNESVSNHLSKYHYNTEIVAKDGAVVEDLQSQLEKIPKKLLNKKNILFVSIGGNDLLNNYSITRDNLGDASIILGIFDNYKREITNIIKKTKMTIVLLDLYYPPQMTEYFKIIDMWNELLKQYASDLNIPVLEVSEILNKDDDFEDEIEPSNKGGKILVKAIYDKAYKKK